MDSQGECVCQICAERYTCMTRRPVECTYCNVSACYTCVRRYLTSNFVEPNCMFCKREWNTDFMDASMSDSFMTNEWRKHHEVMLFDREKSMIPATLPLVERRIKLVSIANRRSAVYQQRIRVMEELLLIQADIRDAFVATGAPTRSCPAINGFPGFLSVIWQYTPRCFICANRHRLSETVPQLPTTDPVMSDAFDGLHADYRRVVHTGFRCEIDMELLEAEIVDNNGGTTTDRAAKYDHIYGCPTTNCRGFLDDKYECCVCRIKACRKCREIVPHSDGPDDRHTCDPDILLTIQMLAKDTRACPKCASLIYKISGCSQMFCVKCHTAFDWKTGKVETGRIHNPHYYEMLRLNAGDGEIPREAGDTLVDPMCTRIIHHHEMKVRSPVYDEVLRSILHISLEVLTSWKLRPVDALRENEDSRIRFIMQEMDEKAFKAKLFLCEKTVKKRSAFRGLLEVYVATTSDLLRTLDHTNMATVNQQMDTVNAYVNAQMYIIGKKFNCVYPIPRLSTSFSSADV